MAETRWKFIAFIFGFICLTSGRVLRNFNLDENSESGLNGNELIDQISDNLLQKDLRRGAAGRPFKQERLSLAEFSTYSLQQPNGPGTYAFGYDNVVDEMGNEQFRSEEKLQNGTVVGEYGYTDYKNKKIVRVTYTADTRGYRAKTEILPLDVIY